MRFSSVSTKLCTRVCSPLDSSGTHHAAINLSIEAPCTAVRGSLYWDPRKSVENGESVKSRQEYIFFPIWGINTDGLSSICDARFFYTRCKGVRHEAPWVFQAY